MFVVALSFCALFAPSANAAVTPSISVALSNNKLGAHADTTVTLNFSYGADDPTLYPAPSDWRESVKHMVVDIPPGLVGNPNAIPYDERCDMTTFETGLCPATATVGTFTIKQRLLPLGTDTDPPPSPGDGYINVQVPTQGGVTRLSLLKTDPEVPATFGIYVKPPFGFDVIRQKIQIAPDTATDLKLRTITLDPVTQMLQSGGEDVAHLRIDKMVIKFLGKLTNGNAFMTNPTDCREWGSSVYANAHYFNDNADSAPLGALANDFKRGDAPPIIPDCTNQTNLPFPITGTTTISSNARDVSPDFDFTIKEPGVQANDDAVSTTPKKIVTTVPASINVDVNQLGRVCENVQFAADACPASTKIGTVAIETPLIRAGLSGDVYLVRAIGHVLPDLGMHIRGAIHFTQRGHNSYIGPEKNQIQTVFDDIPQVGFSKLNVHLFGGPNGLLRSLKCPESNRQPSDGSFTYDFYSYAGQATSSSTTFKQTNCFGIQKLRSFKCVYRLLRFQPTYTSRARIKSVGLSIDRHHVATSTHRPFQFRVPVAKFKPGKHKITLRALYDDGTISEKRSSFTRCGR